MGKVKPAAGSDPRSLDDLVFGILAESERRTALRYLAHCQHPVSVEELAAAVTAEEAEASASAIDEQRRAAIRLLLTHVHVPKLVESGLVEYGPGTERLVLSALGRDLSGLRSQAWSAFDITFDGVCSDERA